MDNSHEVLVPIILDTHDLDGIRTDGLIPAYRIEGCGRLERRSVSLIGSSKTHIKGRSLVEMYVDNKKKSTNLNRIYIDKLDDKKVIRAKNFKLKQQLIGCKSVIDFDIVDNNTVVLTKVSCDDPTQDIVIPSFITDFKRSEIIYKKEGIIEKVTGPFTGVYCNSIKIEARLSDMSYLFAGIADIKSGTVDFCGNKPISIAGLFFSSYLSFSNIKFERLDTTNLLDISLAFSGCSGLKSINIEDNLSNIRFAIGTFENCKTLKNITWDVGLLTGLIDMSRMFRGCSSLLLDDMTFLSKCKPVYMDSTFCFCNILDIKSIEQLNASNLISSSRLFYNSFIESETLDISGWDTHNIVDMSYMFSKTKNVKQVIFGNIDMRNARILARLFYCNKDISKVDLSGIKVENIESTNSMFYLCLNLSSIRLWDGYQLDKGFEFSNMFRGCAKLIDLELNHFDLNQVINDSGQGIIQGGSTVFSECEKLEKLDLSNCNINSEISLEGYFSKCYELKEIIFPEIREAKRVKLLNMDDAFSYCVSLNRLDLSIFDASDIKQCIEPFYACTKLKCKVNETFESVIQYLNHLVSTKQIRKFDVEFIS